MIFFIQLTIAIIIFVTLPVWKKVNSKAEEADENTVVMTVPQALKQKKAKSAIGVFFGSCGIESMCLVWASTFLAESKGFSADSAAKTVTIYFMGLTLGRFLSGIIASKLASDKIIAIGQSITFVAVMLLLFNLPVAVIHIGLFMIGFGNGPLFPNMTHLTPIVFGKEKSQSMIGIEMGFSSVSILFVPLVFGFIAKHFSTSVFPYYLILLYALMIISTFFLFKKEKSSQ